MPLVVEPSHALHVSSPHLQGLSLPYEILQRLDQAGFTSASEIFLTPPGILKTRTGFQADELKRLLDLLAGVCSPTPVTVLTHTRSKIPDTITFGSPALDKLFGQRGGITTGQLTEIAGESAAGKTCVCLQLSLRVQLPKLLGGLRGSCIYISSECHFPFSRLRQMALALCQRDDVQASLDSEGTTSSNPNLSDVLAEGLMTNVYPTRVSNTEGLIHAIHYQLPALIGRLADDSSPTIPVRLIVLDSIGALLRPDGSKTKSSWTLRSSQLNQIADGLKHLAHRYNLAAVVINQVSDVFDALAPRIRTGTDAVKGKGPSLEMLQLENNRVDQPINYAHSTGGVYSSSSGMQSPGRHPVKCSSPKSSAGIDQVASSPLMVYDEQAEHFMGRTLRLRKEASLGLSWSNAINSRIMLHRLTSFRAFPTSNSGKSLPQSVVGDVREARMIFGPFGGEGNAYGSTGVRYIIEGSGISALEDYLLLAQAS